MINNARYHNEFQNRRKAYAVYDYATKATQREICAHERAALQLPPRPSMPVQRSLSAVLDAGHTLHPRTCNCSELDRTQGASGAECWQQLLGSESQDGGDEDEGGYSDGKRDAQRAKVPGAGGGAGRGLELQGKRK